MTAPDDPNTLDPALLDLFRSDVAVQKSVLEYRLLSLKDDPDTAACLDALAQATMAVKGTAQIVGLDAVADFAGAMYECFSAARKGSVSLQSEQIDMLSRGAKLLGDISEAADTEIEGWSVLHGEEIDNLHEGFARITAPESELKPQTPLPTELENRQQPDSTENLSLIDPIMQDIFRTEVTSNAQVLSEGLLLLEAAPGSAATETLDALMRAAHSIKGAGRIVDLDQVVKVAHAMEDCFVAARKGEICLLPQHIDVLLRSIDTLVRISGAVDKSRPQGLEDSVPIDELVGAIRAICTEGLAAPTQLQAPAPPSASPDNRQPDATENLSLIDPIMQDIFRTEVASNAQVLSEGLLLLEADPGSAATETLDALMRAAHSIKGAGRIVDLDQVVKVAHAMEDCFVAARKGEICLLPQHIDVLLRSIDTLVRISGAVDKSRPQGLEDSVPIDELVGAIRAICTEGLAAPTLTLTPRPPAAVSPSVARKPQPSAQPEKPFSPPAVSESPEAILKGEEDSSAEPRQKEPTGKGRMIRVAATKIERLIGLAGEVVVNTRWLPLFSDSLLLLKKNQAELSALLDRLQDASGSGKTDELLHQAKEKTNACSLFLAERINRLNTFISNTTNLSDRHYQEAVGVRMRPFADGGDVRGLPRMVRDLARSLGKKVKIEIIGRSTEVDRDILERLDAPLNHLLRNAVDHGIESPEERRAAGKPETGTVRLQVEHRSGMLMIKISDDGRGIDLGSLKQQILKKGLANAELVERLSETELMDFLFLPGFSTARKVTEISGRGVGLDVVHSMVHEVGGIVRAFAKPGEGITFLLELPLTLSVVRTLLITIAGEPYAFPLARIDRCLLVSNNDILKVEERQYFRYNDKNIALVNIHHVLEIPEPEDRSATFYVVVVSDRTDAYGLVVDGFLGECDLVVRPLDPRLGKVANFSAAALLLDGTPVLIFDIDDLVCSINNQLNGKRLSAVATSDDTTGEKVRKRILVVDDSITVRELERKMLEHKGYEVEVAVDGMDGWNAVRSNFYDMVISDVDMPRMNGIEMITQIRQHSDFKSLPIIIISYKDKEEDRLAGLQAGANYYLTKSSFQDHSFIDAVIDLIGEADDTNCNS